jgi:hypothetical protein
MTCNPSSPYSVLLSLPAQKERIKTGFCSNSSTSITPISDNIDSPEAGMTNPAEVYSLSRTIDTQHK